MYQPQRTRLLIGQARLVFWLCWVFANLAGGIIGGVFGSLAFSILSNDSLFDPSSPLSQLRIFLIVLPWFTSIIIGLAVGLAQWLVLRNLLLGSSILDGLGWVFFTGIGIVLGVTFIGLPIYFAAFTLLLPVALSFPSTYTVIGSIAGLVTVIAGGATIGFAQWSLLKKYVNDAQWWIFATSAGWLMGVVASGLTLDFSDNWTVAAFSSLGYGDIGRTAIAGGTTSLIVGVTTGLLLIWLTQSDSNANIMPRMAVLGFAFFLVTAFAAFYTYYISANPAGQLAMFHLPTEARSVAFSSDGKYIAAGDTAYAVAVWRVADGQRLFSLTGTMPDHTKQGLRRSSSITAWSPNGRYLATTSDIKEQAIRVWDTSSWQSVVTSTIPPDVHIISGEDSLGIDTSVPDMEWSPNGEKLAVIVANIGTCCDGNTHDWSSVRVFNFTGGEPAETLDYPTLLLALAWSPDGHDLALGASDVLGNNGDPRLNEVVDWDLAKGGGPATTSNTSILVPPPIRSLSLDWAPDGTRIAIGLYDEDQRVWDILDNKYLSLLPTHNRTVRDVAWSPDGRLLASASEDLTARVVDVLSNKIRATFHCPDGVTSIDWSPDGNLLVTGSDDGAVRLWSAPK